MREDIIPTYLCVICRVERRSLMRAEFKDTSIIEWEERGNSSNQVEVHSFKDHS